MTAICSEIRDCPGLQIIVVVIISTTSVTKITYFLHIKGFHRKVIDGIITSLDSKHKLILKQWIALKVHSFWLKKFLISFINHLRSTCMGLAPENIVTVARIREL